RGGAAGVLGRRPSRGPAAARTPHRRHRGERPRDDPAHGIHREDRGARRPQERARLGDRHREVPGQRRRRIPALRVQQQGSVHPAEDRRRLDDRELLGEPGRQGRHGRQRHAELAGGVLVRRRAIFVVMALATWVAGSALGAMGGSVAATAQGSGIVVGKAHAGFTPSRTGTKPIVLLMVGSGARPGEDVEHSLADSLHLVFINPAKHHATLVGIPRDSYVPIPNHGSSKINSSIVYGGPALLVDTIENMSGVTIDYWAITTFWGFEDMIDGVGGLTMNVPFAMSDSYARSGVSAG